MLVYGLLNMSSVQEYIKDKLVDELRSKLSTDLNIGSLYIQPFNTIQLNDIYLNDREGDTILIAEKIYAGFDLLPLLNNSLVITDARLADFEIYLSKDDPNTPLNIQFIIDAFKPKESTNNNKLDVKINSINITNGNLHFDVEDRPAETNKFDPNHIQISNLNAKLALKSLNTDSLNIQIKKLELKEKSGLVIDNLIARFITKNQHLSVKGFKLNLPKSLLQFDKFEVDYSIFRIPADLISYATFETQINSSYVVLSDIAAFVPALEHFEDRILFRTDISGKVDSIQVSGIRLDYGEKMHLTAEGFVQDIRNHDKTFVQGNINSLTVTEDGIIGILNNLSKEKKEIPPILSNLGPVSFQGDVSGYLKHMNARGNLQSQLGNIEANAIIGLKPDANTELFFDGKIETNEFHLGDLLNNKDFDTVSFDFMASATKIKNEKMKGTVEGIIHDFTFKKYSYHDININGKYNDNIIDGGISFDDPNAIFSINGLFDFSESIPKMNFEARLKNIRLDNLNLSEKYKESYFSLYMDANFSGKTIDGLQGSIKADSITFLQSGKRFDMNNLLIEASKEEESEERELSIQSDIINGKVTGIYSFSTIIESLKKTFSDYLPSLISYKEKRNIDIKDNNLHFDFTINNTENASDVFKLPVTIYSPTKIIGFYDNQLERFKLEAYMPSLAAAGAKIQSGYLLLQNPEGKLSSNISGSFITKKGTVNDLTIDITAERDIIDIHTLFLNKNQEQLKGEFSNSVAFSRTENNQLQTDFHFLPGELVLNNTLWEIKKSWIRIAEGGVNVNEFTVKSENKEQELNIDGTYSPKDESKILNIKLKNIDLDYIFSTLAIDALQFGGSTNGTLNVSSIQNKPYADVNLNVSDFSFNKTNLGNLILTSDLDPENLKVNMLGQIINENNKKTDINGYIKPVTQELSIDFDAEEVNMAFLNKYVETLFNNVQGRGTGKVRLFGDFSNVTVEGTAFVQNGGIGINFLNTYYTFTDTVYMKKDLIYFSDISFNDEKGNIAKVSGRVVHDYFSNFMYFVELAGSNFMLYNTTERMNPMFYGTVFASGTGVIKGDEQNVDLNMNIRTNANTNVYMNFMEETAQEYSFITYKTPEQKNDSTATNGSSIRNRLKTDSGIEMNMNFYVDATPDATVELLMDPVGGDRIKGTGSGAMQFVWGTNKDPMLYGTYNILQGSYNFTFQKLMERRFMIQDGSSVQFRGDPFQANLDVTASYRVVANLNDLDRNLAELSGQSSIPVNCILNLTGPLRRPNVGLDIELPNADPEIQRQVKSLMPTEDMINRQIVYLLILSKFYTPSYAVTDQRTSDFAALASATLSTQLSKILSKIDDRWQIGTSIRTSDSELNNTEVELILSSRLLNDRVLFNGNFGYRDNIYTNDAFIGDIDIEVLLNRMGTWRLKAYNHYNEKYYYIKNSTQTQGLGIVYKRDFDNISELFTRPKKTQKPIENDTIAVKDTIPLSAEFVIMKK